MLSLVTYFIVQLGSSPPTKHPFTDFAPLAQLMLCILISSCVPHSTRTPLPRAHQSVQTLTSAWSRLPTAIRAPSCVWTLEAASSAETEFTTHACRASSQTRSTSIVKVIVEANQNEHAICTIRFVNISQQPISVRNLTYIYSQRRRKRMRRRPSVSAKHGMSKQSRRIHLCLNKNQTVIVRGLLSIYPINKH